MATEALVSIASGARVECLIAEARTDRAFLQGTNKITFNDEDMEVGYLDHRRPPYLTASIYQIPIKRALVDTRASVNLIPLSTASSSNTEGQDSRIPNGDNGV